MPANTTYLIFRPDEQGHLDHRSTEIWSGDPPVAGEDMPPGSVACVWIIFNNDVNPRNYYRTNQNSLILLPESVSN